MKRKHGRMPIQRDELQELVDQGLSIRALADRLEVTTTTVQRWLRWHGLNTKRGGARLERSRRARDAGLDEVEQRCPRHGPSSYVRRADGAYRCRKCASEAVVRRRKRVKEILVAEAGGQCVICGYDRYAGALQFHHVDPRDKRFALAGSGLTRAISVARTEAAKCVLLCATCHAEVEGGVVELPLQFRADRESA